MIIEGVRIVYGVIDTTLDADPATVSASENSDYSNGGNTVDGATVKTKLTYLENNYFVLDGSHVFPETSTTYDVGWESDSISDASGNINEYIEYVFSNLHDSYGVQIVFPDYCVADSFTLTYYNNTTQVGTITITGNTSSTYSNYDIRSQWNRARLTFTKINPQQRARLWQIVFGISDQYNEDVLISVSASRATDLTGDYDESGDFSFQFLNDGRFNIKTINDLPVSFQEGLKTTIYVRKKGSSQYTVWGNYYSENTSVSENGKVITISGYDELYSLNDTTYRNGIVYPEGRSLYAWAQEVAADAGITLSIDGAFQNIISTGYITEVPHREALRLIAEAGNGILVIDANGNIALKKHTPAEKGSITQDDIVEGGYSVENTDKYLGINVTKYTFSPASEDHGLGYLEEIGLTTDPQEIEIVYSEYPAIVSTIQIFVDETSSVQIIDSKIYSDRCVVTVTGTDGDTTFITVTGKPYNRSTNAVTRGSTVKNIKTIEGNYLITEDIADDVADYQYARVVNKYVHNAEIVNETDYDLGDRVEIDTGNDAISAQSTDDGQYITKISFDISYDNNTVTIEALDE